MPPTTYDSEADLVADLVGHFVGTPVGCEFYYGRGRTDVVVEIMPGEVLAVEAKLKKWREALQQAYRNRCFAHRSYVALPPESAEIALQYESEFTLRAVGLLVVTASGLEVALDCAPGPPLQPWLTNLALSAARARDACSNTRPNA